jgi:hypothetical protein
MGNQFEVLNPWAEVDLLPLRGISPRLTDLNYKTIGLFTNHKPAASPILDKVEEKLKERYPTLKFSRIHRQSNLPIVETKDKDKFEEWLKGVDAVINAVGD